MQQADLNIDDIGSNEFNSLVKEFASPKVPTVRRAVDKLAFLEKLNTTIEIEPLLAIYAQEVCLRLPITGIEFELDKSYQLKYSSLSRHCIVSKLAIQGQAIGTVKYLSSGVLSASQRQLIASLEEQLIQPLHNVVIFERNKQLSYRDYLTNLGNRSYFEQTLSNMKATAQREHRSFSLVLLDLDNFKQVNDQHGHNQGDLVLKEFAKILRQATRTNDHVFRYGGDEFVVLLAHADNLNPSLVANRIIDMTVASPLLHKHQVTTSIGFSNWREGDSSAQLTDRADKALYRAKHQGKNTYFAA